MGFGAFPPTARERVVVTGIGLVTPLGIGVQQTWRNLCAGHTGTRSLREVPHFFPSVLRNGGARKQSSSSLTSSSSSSSGGNADDALTAQEELILKALPCQVAAPVCPHSHRTFDCIHSAVRCTNSNDDGAVKDNTVHSRANRNKTGCCTGRGACDVFAPTGRETRALLFVRHAVNEALIDAGLLRPSCPSNINHTASSWSNHYNKHTIHRDDSGGSSNKDTFTTNNSSSSCCSQSLTSTTTRTAAAADTTLLHAPCGCDRIGVNIGIGIPSLTDISEVACHLYADAARVHYRHVHPFFVPKILGNMAAGAVAIEYGLTGPIGSGVAACATGAHCIGEAAQWIRSGRADVVVCGATEACITPVSVAGFGRMRALSTRYNTQPAHASRPFDAARDGFVMGEGAGVLVLESLSHARARGCAFVCVNAVDGDVDEPREECSEQDGQAGKSNTHNDSHGAFATSNKVHDHYKTDNRVGDCVEDTLAKIQASESAEPQCVIYGELRGFGVACDAHDVAAPHPDGRGARRCIVECLRDGGHVPAQAVRYVNAHATGTMGDEIELRALARTLRPAFDPIERRVSAPKAHDRDEQVFRGERSLLRVSSSKGAMGHLLGAAGSVEAAIALLALHHRTAPPTANLVHPCWSEEMQRVRGVYLVGASAPEPLPACEAVMSTSFGFGGINTALLFTRI